jgi:hypothetical protein
MLFSVARCPWRVRPAFTGYRESGIRSLLGLEVDCKAMLDQLLIESESVGCDYRPLSNSSRGLSPARCLA